MHEHAPHDHRPVALVWFRRDLRLDDHPALRAALDAGFRPIPIYLHAPEESGRWAAGGASRVWLQHSLHALSQSLNQLGSGLLIRTGPSEAALQTLIAETGAKAVFWNRRYDTAGMTIDRQIKATLLAQGLRVESFNAQLLFEPWQIQTGQGGPYRVFTPFWRKATSLLDRLPAPDLPPSQLPAIPPARDGKSLHSVPIAALGLAAQPTWDHGFWEVWQPGEAGAHARWREFSDQLPRYASGRDIPAIDATSMLSPHLAFGEISPRRLLTALHDYVLEGGMGAETFLRELGWREFSWHLLYHFPTSAEHDLTDALQGFDWRTPSPSTLAAWQQGRTGIPIVDAGMRQLWQTGWMHNRVRMLVASYLTKHLRIHWRHGADWFWDTLVDADLGNNTQGWQWSAGTGADAAPYFRIFNPVTQGQRFDPAGDYVRYWVPELRQLPNRVVHTPWLHAAGGLGSYPRQPLVDPAHGRADALAAYQRCRQSRTEPRPAP